VPTQNKSLANQQLGVMANRKGKFEEALNYFKNALKADPTNEEARFNYEIVKKKLEEKKKQEEQQKQNKDQKKDDQKKEDQKKDDKKIRRITKTIRITRTRKKTIRRKTIKIRRTRIRKTKRKRISSKKKNSRRKKTKKIKRRIRRHPTFCIR